MTPLWNLTRRPVWSTILIHMSIGLVAVAGMVFTFRGLIQGNLWDILVGLALITSAVGNGILKLRLTWLTTTVETNAIGLSEIELQLENTGEEPVKNSGWVDLGSTKGRDPESIVAARLESDAFPRLAQSASRFDWRNSTELGSSNQASEFRDETSSQFLRSQFRSHCTSKLGP